MLIAYAIGAVLLGAELFTNALEHLGARCHVSEGVTASVFAAVATAMPEASVPVIAILEHGSTGAIREQVATGAILGAPLMLSTVAFFVMGIAAAWKRGVRSPLCPEPDGLRRDLSWFMASFSLAALATLLPEDASSLRVVVAALLVILYARYLLVTIRASAALVAAGHGTRVARPLHAARLKGFSSGPPGIAVQLLSGFFLIVLGTRGFLNVVSGLSSRFPPLALSLIIIPIATELPEKVNSVLWIRRGGQDTLAFG
ncbi:MAG: sodium:calcium antiporter, partial [Acidiferrobacteraceae bacterium]